MYVIFIYYDILDILELQVYLPSEDNFYYYLSMLSSIPGREGKIKLYGWNRILFKFPKRLFLWIDVSKWGAYWVFSILSMGELHLPCCSVFRYYSCDLIYKYVSYAFYSEWYYWILPIKISP